VAVRRIIASADHTTSADPLAAQRTVDVAATRSVARNRSERRSQALVEAVAKLDTATDPAYAAALMQWIADQYAERNGGTLVGIFSRCYLGHPYIDHRLDVMGGMIMDHFTAADTPPGPFAAARPYARSDAYAYTEVYSDGAVVPIREDGQPVL